VAQNQNKRRRKRRGTQGGRIDTSRRTARPRSREEAKARARNNRSSGGATRTQKADLPPTWRNSIIRGLGAAIIFALLLMFIFQRPVSASLTFGAFMLAFYIPAGYYIDLALWRKRERQRIREQRQ
jgi:hypothetical protein